MQSRIEYKPLSLHTPGDNYKTIVPHEVSDDYVGGRATRFFGGIPWAIVFLHMIDFAPRCLDWHFDHSPNQPPDDNYRKVVPHEASNDL